MTRLRLAVIITTGLLVGSPDAGADVVKVGGWQDPGWDAYSNEDYETAVKAWTEFDSQSDHQTLIRIGWMYKYGEGLEVDHQKAAYYFLKAAKTGHAWSQFNLGDIYFKAEGNVDQDLEKAYMWYLLAQKGGFERTNRRLIDISRKMTADQIARATKAAEESPYKQRTSNDRIMADTLREAKNMFLREYMKARNKEVGELKRTAEVEQEKTAGELFDEWYEKFLGIPAYMMTVLDTQSERRWSSVPQGMTKKARENVSIAKYYKYGGALEEKYTRSAKLFDKATLRGDPSAAANLGFLYYFGNGVPLDIMKSHMWFNVAASGGISRAHFLIAQVEERMTPDQIEDAKQAADEWVAELPEG